MSERAVGDEAAMMSWFMAEYQPDKKVHVADSTNFVEITGLPKKIEPRALTSMIVTGSKIVPKQTEICCKEESMERVALVEFKTVVDAYQAVDRLRTSHFGRRWHMRFVTNPKFADPEKELIERWLLR